MTGIGTNTTRSGLALLLVAGLLGGCGVAQEGSVLSPSFWSMSPLNTTGQNDLADLGLAELAKGNHVAAENYFKKALKLNPKDVHALLGAGMLYQQTGQTTKAREMYEAVLALRPKETDKLVSLAETPRSISEIANTGLGQIEGRPSTAAPGMEPPPGGISGAPSGSLMLGRAQDAASMPGGVPGGPPVAQMRPLGPGVADAAQRSSPIGAKFSGADANVVSRFTTLRMLREQGLVTAEEYSARRQANIGALLPLTSPPPSAGLDRSVPPADQIVGRLRAIGRALEMRALTVAQHASERAMILDALLPSAPVVVANPGVPPKEMMAAADAVRRIEFLRDGGLVSAEEYARERKAVEIAMTPPTPEPLPKAAEEVPVATPAGPVARAAKGGQAAVHLASYRSRQQADRGWQQIKRAHGEILGNLEPEVSEVNLGKGKGTYFRLKAGPIANKKTAADICGKLKQRRQYCEPADNDG